MITIESLRELLLLSIFAALLFVVFSSLFNKRQSKRIEELEALEDLERKINELKRLRDIRYKRIRK